MGGAALPWLGVALVCSVSPPALAQEPTSTTPTPPNAAPTPPATGAKHEADDTETHDERAEPSAEKERNAEIERYVDRSFENDTETRTRAVAAEKRLVADRIEQVLGNFVDIGGYFRAGYARDTAGGPMPGFQAPGAASKYRLGNEAENYGELIIGKSFYVPGVFHLDDSFRPDGSPRGPIARVQLRLSFTNPYAEFNDAAATNVGLPEAWASIGNVIDAMPSVKFWAGNRFYRRHDIHIIDFFFWDMSGGGAGIEDVQLGSAKLALAWIGLGSTSGLSYLPQPDPTNAAGYSKSSWELRLYDLPLGSTKLEMGVTYAHSESGLDEAGREAPNSSGMAFNLVHTTPEFLSADGTNKFSVQYGTGAAKTFTAGFETYVSEGATFVRPESTGAVRFRATESFTTNVNDHFSLGPVIVYQATNFDDGDGLQHWFSAGLRPIVHFNKYLNFALEGGVDWSKNEGRDTEGVLYKLTFAPEVSIDSRFMSRPVIRAFCTFAGWSDEFVGQVGGLDYQNESSGVALGGQMEAWW